MNETLQTYIISGFPGVGKTHYTGLTIGDTQALDSDSSAFSWVEEHGKKVRNPEFPKNYLEHIRSNIGKVVYLFVSTHELVRNALIAAEIPFNIIYPSKDQKSLYMWRYEERGSAPEFMELMRHSFARFIDEIDAIDSPFCNRIQVGEHTVSTVLHDYNLRRYLVHAKQPVLDHFRCKKRVCLSIETIPIIIAARD